MSIFDLFKAKRTSAKSAKERLQIVISHQRSEKMDPELMPKLREEILNVISKYVSIDQEKIQVQLQNLGDRSILELNVALPGIAVTES